MASFPRSIENCDFSPKSKGETLIKTSKVADFLGKLLKASKMEKNKHGTKRFVEFYNHLGALTMVE